MDRLPGRAASLYLISKTAAACGVAWVVAAEVLAAPVPVLAPLGALIIVQSTVFATLTAAVQRVAGVAAGVGIALVVGSLLGLNAASIVLVVLGGLLVGRLLHLGGHAIEVPISALLVLVVGAVGSDYSFERVLTMLLGAVIGVLTHLVLLPPVAVGPAAHALSALGCSVASLLNDIAGRRAAWGEEEAQAWLARGRRLPELTAEASAALDEAEESARFNPLALRAAPRLRRLRHGLVAAEHIATQARGLTRTLADIAVARDADVASPDELRNVLRHAGDCVQTFTGLVVGDDLGPERLARRRQAALLVYEDAAQALQQASGTGMLWALYGALLADLHAILSEVSPQGAHAAALGAAPPDPDSTGR